MKPGKFFRIAVLALAISVSIATPLLISPQALAAGWTIDPDG